MITIKIFINGKEYFLPDEQLYKTAPIAVTLEKGMHHIFDKIREDFPHDDITAVWNEDDHSVSYSSETLTHDQIAASLKKHHKGLDI